MLNLAHMGPSTKASLPPHSRLQACHPPFAHFAFSPSAHSPPPHTPGCFSTPYASSSPLTPLGLLNGMLGISESGVLNFSNLFCPILLTLFVSRNITLIFLTLFPDSRILSSVI